MREEVQQALLPADLIVPSLDAVTQDVFEKVNRPHPSVNIDDVIEGLDRFRRRYSGLIWIEVMLVAGINDAPEHIAKMADVIRSLSPDKVQLNTVVRPPAEEYAQALDQDKLEAIQAKIGPKAEIIADFSERPRLPQEQDTGSTILDYVRRRPATLTDLSNALGQHRNEVIKHLDLLLEERRLKVVFHEGRKYYEPA
jgi:wyosine [tRNA(Phe)-imidazoG37] synthetase (radical SAM superfamily)